MEDRRIRKTKKAFYNALIELLKDNDIRNISLQDLCNLADSHRSTFYYHYTDIYDLYDELENKILDDFSSVVSANETHSYYDVYDNIISHLYDNGEVWSVLLGSNGNKNFKDKISKILEEKYIAIWEFEIGKKKFSKKFLTIVKANISAFVTLFTEWLNNTEGFSSDEINSMLKDMDSAFDSLLDKYV